MSDASHRIDADELLAQATWLRALARSLVRDEHAADDVVQETFAAAVGRPPREPGALRGWLARVARNSAWKSIRGERRRAAREIAAPRRAEEPSAAEVSARIETQRALLDAVQELDEPFRTVIVMRFYDGKTPREIAAALGVTPEVVWQRLSRATAMLRARLDRKYGKRETWAVLLTSPLGAKSAAAWGTTATTVGTGVAIVGTKTVVAATAAVVLGAWLVWPRAETPTVVPPKETSTVAATATPPVPKTATTPRVRADANAATTSDAAPAVPHAKTRGRVVDAVSGDPIAGATVMIVRKSPGGGFQWTLTTGAEGTFSGDAAETAKYGDAIPWSDLQNDSTVVVSAPGHIRFYESPSSGARGDDLGDVKLERGRTVRGVVVDAEGRAAPGAFVFVTYGSALPGYGFPLLEARRVATSDVAGRFEFAADLPPTPDANVYTLLATTPNGVAFTTLPVRKGTAPIDGVVLAVHAAGATVRVDGPDGRPLAGAHVVAQPRFGAFRGRSQPDAKLFRISEDAALAAAFVRDTGTDGRAVFDTLPVEGGAAVYDFGVNAAGCSPAWQNDCRVPDAQNAEIVISLHRAQNLVAGVRVLDADGRPVEGVQVTGIARPGVTDAEGAFVVGRSRGDPGGTFAEVGLTKDGFVRVRYVRVIDALDDGRPLQEVRMERPTPIEGRVVDDENRPVGGVCVALTRDTASQYMPGRGLTAADGRFAFPDATRGPWNVVVVPQDGAENWVQPPDTPAAGGAHDVVIHVKRLPPGRANVVVDVVDAVTGEPVDAEDVSFGDTRPVRGVHVALPTPRIDAGSVSVGPLRPGDYALWIRVADRPHQLVALHVAEGATDVHATCRVRGGVAISGRIRTPEGFEGKPLRATFLPRDAESVPGGGSWPVTSQGFLTPAADGTFRVEGVTPTAYRVSIRDRGWYADAVVDASESDATVDIEARRGVVLRMRGSDPVDALFAWIEGSIDGGPWFVIEQASMQNGLFDESDTLPPGTLRWRAVFRRSYFSNDTADAAAPQQGELFLESGKDAEIVIPVVPKK